MSVIHYAIEIFLPGITEEDSSIGLALDGDLEYSVIRIVTDRPQYDGSTVVPKWQDDSDNTHVWHNGILSENGISNPNRSINLKGTGEYGTMSGFNFSVSNAMVASTAHPFWHKCQDYGINFINRKVNFYVVVDDIFIMAWSGIISSTPYDETTFKFICNSDFKTVHKSIPPNTINDTNYPDSISESKGKAIPACLGRIPYASIYNVDGLPEEVDLVKDGTTLWKTAQATTYVASDTTIAVTLKTPYLSFNSDEATFLGDGNHYLCAVAGGGSPDTARCYAIINSSTTSAGLAGSVTSVFLSERLDVDATTFNSTYTTSGTFLNRWQFKIFKIGRTNIVSNGAISEFKKDLRGGIQLFDYSDDDKVYRDVSNLVLSSKITAVPEVKTTSNIADAGGIVKYISPIKVAFTTVADSIFETGITLSGAAANVGDRDRSTYYQINVDITDDVDNAWVGIKSYFDIDVNDPAFNVEELWISADIANEAETERTGIFTTSIIVTLVDQYGTGGVVLTNDVPQVYVGPGTDGIDPITYNLIPNEYYQNGGDDNGEDSQFGLDILSRGWIAKDELKIDKSYLDLIRAGVLSKKVIVAAKLNFHSGYTGGNEDYNLTMRVNEFAVFGVVPVDSIGTKLYTRLSGEKTLGGYASDTVLTAFQVMLESYDGLSSGISDLTKDVDFTTMPTTRHNTTGHKWYVGRQLLDCKSSFDYYQELCKNSFVAMFPGRTGQKIITAWLENTAYPSVHDGSVIVRNSFKDAQKTDVKDTYNDFFIRYNYDAGSGKCNRSMTITKVSESAFPDVDTLDLNGNPSWWSFVGGISDYTAASGLWLLCHQSWEKTRSVNQLSIDLPWFPDLRVYENNLAETDGVDIDSASYNFLVAAVLWLTKERAIFNYSIPLTALNLTTEICDPVTVTDAIMTDDHARDGWICGIEIDVDSKLINIQTIMESVA
jgi:hypothetical protein